MFEHVNWLAVLIATAGSFAIGGLWYSPVLFGKAWQADMNITEQKAHPAKVFGLAFAFSFVACVALATLITPDMSLMQSLNMGLLVGVGCVFCAFGVNYQFADRPTRVLLIDGGYHTVQFSMFAVILHYMG